MYLKFLKSHVHSSSRNYHPLIVRVGMQNTNLYIRIGTLIVLTKIVEIIYNFSIWWLRQTFQRHTVSYTIQTFRSLLYLSMDL